MLDELLERLEALEARMDNVVRVGHVVGVDEKRGTVRVRFGDADGTISYDLPVLFGKTHTDKCYHMPDLDEHVTCIFLPNGQQEGFVLGAFYSATDSVPVASRDKRFIRFRDGAAIEYDRALHKLRAAIPGQVEVTASGAVDVFSDAEITARATNLFRVEAPEIELAGNVRALGPLSTGGADGESLPLFINGPVSHFGGNFVSQNDMIASGVSLVNHLHEGSSALPVSTGGSAGSGSLSSWTWALLAATDESSRREQAELFESFRAAKLADPRTTDMDRLLLCIPSIAEAEAGRNTEPDATGWLHLADFLRKWFVGAPSSDKTARRPSFVGWDWLQGYSSFAAKIAEIEAQASLESSAAKALLATRIQALAPDVWASGGEFDHTAVAIEKAHDYYFQSLAEKWIWPPIDGLDASLGRYALFALARGRVDVDGDSRVITVSGASVFVRDNFDFEGFYPLGQWDCDTGIFDGVVPYNVDNGDFRNFRQRNGVGGDFYVYAAPRNVDGFTEYVYAYE